MKPNWFLFYRDDAFFELIGLPGRLLARTGNCNTHGRAQENAFASEQEVDAALAVQRQRALDEGFSLARTWTVVADRFDGSLLERELTLGVRATLAALRRRHPNINAVALVTDESRMTISVACHAFDALASADDEQLWNPDEWAIGDDGHHLDAAYRLLLAQFHGVTQVDFGDFVRLVDAAMLGALSALRAEGSITSDSIALPFVTDAPYLTSAIERLHPRAVFERFRRWADPDSEL